MTKDERKVVVRLMHHMQELQRQIAKPTPDDSTDEEVLKLLDMFWEWRPTPSYPLPGKHTVENMVGLMRGCEPGQYAYISRGALARIIRKAVGNRSTEDLHIILNKDADQMDDYELYDYGKWNYKPTPFVDLLFHMQSNPQLFTCGMCL